MKKLTLSLIGIALLLAVTPCLATPVTFANFTNLGTQDVTLAQLLGSNSLGIADMPIEFQFHHVAAAAMGSVAAHITLSASTVLPGTLIPLPFILIQQPGYGTAPAAVGSFTITRDSDGSNLLSGIFSAANLSGINGGESAEFGASTAVGAMVSFSSDYIDFAPGSRQAFSLSMSSVTPGLGLIGPSPNFLSPFTASESGTFSAQLPEPISMLLVGAGLVGLALLRRKRK